MRPRSSICSTVRTGGRRSARAAPRWSPRDRMLAARMDKGDKSCRFPEVAMLERAQTAGVASGVLIGDSALIVAVVPVGAARRRAIRPTSMLAQPLAARRSAEGDRRAGHAVRRHAGDFGGGQRAASRRRCRGWSAGRRRAARAIPTVDLAGAADGGGAEAVAVGAAHDGARRRPRTAMPVLLVGRGDRAGRWRR